LIGRILHELGWLVFSQTFELRMPQVILTRGHVYAPVTQLVRLSNAASRSRWCQIVGFSYVGSLDAHMPNRRIAVRCALTR
jgi:hypothetical protein